MKRTKKSLLCFLFCCLFLTGCAVATQEITDSVENSCTELTLFSDVSFWNPPAWSFEEGSITAGISKKTGAWLNFTIPPQDASKKLSLMILKDELPDLIVATDNNVINQLIRSGKVWSLQEFFETYCPDSHLLKDFPKDRKQEYIRQYGDWYAYPSHLNTEDARKIWKEKTSYYGDLFTHSFNHGIMFNRKLLAQANLTVSDVQTASQVLDAFEKVKNLAAEDGQSIIPLLLEGNQYLDSSVPCLIGSFGAEVIDDDGNYIERFLQPECKDAFAFLNTSFRKGYAFSEDLTLDNLQLRDLMASDRVFCFIGNTSNTSVDATEWVSAGPILSDSGERPVMSIDLSVPTGWMQTFVSKSCKNPELVARFFDYMTSDEGLLYSNYGVENEDYTFDQDGYIHRTTGGQQRYNDSNDMLGLFWNFSNIAWEHSLIPVPAKGSRDDSLNQIQTAFARYPDTYVYDSALLRLPDNYISPDSEEGQIESTLDAYRNEQIPKILSASSDAEFEEQYQLFVNTQKELGAEQLDEKINLQMQENFSYYGKKIEKVNPHTQKTSKQHGETTP